MKTIKFDDAYAILEALGLDDSYIKDAFWGIYEYLDNGELEFYKMLRIMKKGNKLPKFNCTQKQIDDYFKYAVDLVKSE